jgi:hypothetical protein
MVGSFLPFWFRVRVKPIKMDADTVHADPDPKTGYTMLPDQILKAYKNDHGRKLLVNV